MQTLHVQLHERSYPILIAPNLLEQFAALIAQHRLGACFVLITDAVVDRLYAGRVLAQLQNAGLRAEKIVVPAGERHKSLATFNRVVGEMLKMKCGRDTVVLALGGGVVGDLAGFVAATYMRGLDFIQIPTTLLAQVDAGIGGKVAVNHRLGKNMIGAFHQPRLVLIDTGTLDTLPQREIVCGLAEMIKHALICDRAYFETFERDLPELLKLHSEKMGAAIARSCAIKAAIVSQDERESGRRAWLNFGHTVGHALEAACGFETLRHGEAVVLGMLAEAYISKMTQRLSVSDFERITNFLRTLPLTLRLDGICMDEIEDFIARDKKALGGEIRMVLLRAIGEAEVTSDWPRGAALREAVDFALAVFAAPVAPAQ
jgi:3-dehydroquinate synthase